MSVDVDRPAVIVHEASVGCGYTNVREYRHGTRLSQGAFRGGEVRVEEVLGRL